MTVPPPKGGVAKDSFAGIPRPLASPLCNGVLGFGGCDVTSPSISEGILPDAAS